ncbi:MAG: asparaginase [Bacillota bacterium]|nr:asparaginase [Bacillota bacterium]
MDNHADGRDKPARPRVVLMTTGGTIGTGADYGTRLPGAELLGLIPSVLGQIDVVLDEADNRPSPFFEPAEMLALAKRARGHLASPEVAGIVITFGTDAMDEMVYLLDVTNTSGKPIVATGAMFNTKSPYPDGPRNLHDALLVAASPAARGCGAVLVMNGAIHPGGEVVKINSMSIDAFASPKYGPLGSVEGGQVAFRRAVTGRETIAAGEIEPQVDLIATSVGMDARFVDASVAAGSRGMVLAAMGGGALPMPMMPRLRELAEGGFPILVASRCLLGGVRPPRGVHAAGRGMLLTAGDLPPHKARIKLMLALAAVRHLAPPDARRQLAAFFAPRQEAE